MNNDYIEVGFQVKVDYVVVTSEEDVYSRYIKFAGAKFKQATTAAVHLRNIKKLIHMAIFQEQMKIRNKIEQGLLKAEERDWDLIHWSSLDYYIDLIEEGRNDEESILCNIDICRPLFDGLHYYD